LWISPANFTRRHSRHFRFIFATVGNSVLAWTVPDNALDHRLSKEILGHPAEVVQTHLLPVMQENAKSMEVADAIASLSQVPVVLLW
jgi:hypothetical protein